MSKRTINLWNLHDLINDYLYYTGKHPLVRDIYKTYKNKYNYEARLLDFHNELLNLKKQGNLIDFIDDIEERLYIQKGRKKPQKKIVKVKRIRVRF